MMRKDTVRAHMHRFRYEQALNYVQREHPSDAEAIKTYVNELLAAMYLVRTALRDATKVAGSEYVDENGSVGGALRMIDWFEKIRDFDRARIDKLKEKLEDAGKSIPEDIPENYRVVKLGGCFTFEQGHSYLFDLETGEILFEATERCAELFVDPEQIAIQIVERCPYVVVEPE